MASNVSRTCITCGVEEIERDPLNKRTYRLACGDCSLCLECWDKLYNQELDTFVCDCGIEHSSQATKVVTPESGILPFCKICAERGYKSPCSDPNCFTCKEHWHQNYWVQLCQDKMCSCGKNIERWQPSCIFDAECLDFCYFCAVPRGQFGCPCSFEFEWPVDHEDQVTSPYMEDKEEEETDPIEDLP